MSTIYQHEFEESASGRRVRQVLGHGKTPPEALLEVVRKAVREALPNMTPRRRYTTEQICGPELWAGWSHSEHVCAGICLSYLISIREVPLARHTTRSGSGTRKYFLP